jgi:hypothetical protein
LAAATTLLWLFLVQITTHRCHCGVLELPGAVGNPCAGATSISERGFGAIGVVPCCGRLQGLDQSSSVRGTPDRPYSSIMALATLSSRPLAINSQSTVQTGSRSRPQRPQLVCSATGDHGAAAADRRSMLLGLAGAFLCQASARHGCPFFHEACPESIGSMNGVDPMWFVQALPLPHPCCLLLPPAPRRACSPPHPSPPSRSATS